MRSTTLAIATIATLTTIPAFADDLCRRSWGSGEQSQCFDAYRQAHAIARVEHMDVISYGLFDVHLEEGASAYSAERVAERMCMGYGARRVNVRVAGRLGGVIAGPCDGAKFVLEASSYDKAPSVTECPAGEVCFETVPVLQ